MVRRAQDLDFTYGFNLLDLLIGKLHTHSQTRQGLSLNSNKVASEVALSTSDRKNFISLWVLLLGACNT